MKRAITSFLLFLLLGGGTAWAKEGPAPGPFDELGATVLGPAEPHWVWVTDIVFRHSQIFDAENGKMLGSVDHALGTFPRPPIFSTSRSEYYVVEARYEWGYRGKRTSSPSTTPRP